MSKLNLKTQYFLKKNFLLKIRKDNKNNYLLQFNFLINLKKIKLHLKKCFLHFP